MSSNLPCLIYRASVPSFSQPSASCIPSTLGDMFRFQHTARTLVVLFCILQQTSSSCTQTSHILQSGHELGTQPSHRHYMHHTRNVLPLQYIRVLGYYHQKVFFHFPSAPLRSSYAHIPSTVLAWLASPCVELTSESSSSHVDHKYLSHLLQ